MVDFMVHFSVIEDGESVGDSEDISPPVNAYNETRRITPKILVEDIKGFLLHKKDNEIRNNLKLMDIRLADLIGQIKAVR